MRSIFLLRLSGDHKGVTLVFVAFVMVVLLGFAALAVDVAYLYVVRGELQNAADAGALAGAQVLYNDSGTSVNVGAIQMGKDFVNENFSEKSMASWESVELGHWSFGLLPSTTPRGFTAWDMAQALPPPPELWNKSTAELDADISFINAVRVITKRKRVDGQLPEHFFAKVFRAVNAEVKAVAVGYIGFAGTLTPEEADQPIAICQESIRNVDEEYTCGVGRMINSGNGNDGHQSGGWTNFSQPCETASTPSIRPLICSAGNPNILTLGEPMGTVGGQVQTAADQLRDCWMAVPGIDTYPDGWPDQPWTLTLPVIECPDANVGPCSTVVGAVTVDVVWITRNDKQQMNEVPRKMGSWPEVGDQAPRDPTTGKCSGTGQQCWDSFVDYFDLEVIDLENPLNPTPAFYEDKTLYFLPSCEPHIPAGKTGGQNFGILAKIPVLVK